MTKNSDSITDDNTPDKLAAALARLEAEKEARVMARLAQPDYQAKIAFRSANETEAEARERFRGEHGEAADLVITWKAYDATLIEPPPQDVEIEIPSRDDYAPEPPPEVEESDAREAEGGVESRDWAKAHFERHPYGPHPFGRGLVGEWN
jgi:hypothetical protein